MGNLSDNWKNDIILASNDLLCQTTPIPGNNPCNVDSCSPLLQYTMIGWSLVHSRSQWEVEDFLLKLQWIMYQGLCNSHVLASCYYIKLVEVWTGKFLVMMVMNCNHRGWWWCCDLIQYYCQDQCLWASWQNQHWMAVLAEEELMN